MRRLLLTVSALLMSVFFLVTGNGLQGTLLSVRAQIDGFGLVAVGLLGTAYFLGFLLGCLYTGRLIQRVGHIRTFAILAAVASQIALAHSFLVTPIAWFVFRAISGFCLAGLALIIESWLNENATNETRGKMISTYRIVDLSGIFLSQMVFSLAAPEGFGLFALVACLLSLSLIPVSATTSRLPRTSERVTVNVPKVWKKAQTAITTSFVIGLANGAFWTLAPLYAFELGGSRIWVSIFMALMVLGGGLAVWPIGAWSDRVDRRLPIFICTMIVLSTCAIALFAPLPIGYLLPVVGFLYGVGALPQYGLAIAHANDTAEADEFVEVSSTLLFTFAIASIMGPLAASIFMRFEGPGAMFVFIGAVHLISASHSLTRMFAHRLSNQDKEKFLPITRSTQEIFDVDPRSDEDAPT